MRFLQEEVLENIRGKMLKKKNQKDSWDWNVSTLRRQPEALEKNSDTKRKLSETGPFASCAKDAPVCFVLCYRKECRYQEYVQIDLSATADNMLIVAEQLGLGAVCLGIAPLKKRLEAVKNVINIAGEPEAFALIPCGYIDEMKAPRNNFEEDRVNLTD